MKLKFHEILLIANFSCYNENFMQKFQHHVHDCNISWNVSCVTTECSKLCASRRSQQPIRSLGVSSLTWNCEIKWGTVRFDLTEIFVAWNCVSREISWVCTRWNCETMKSFTVSETKVSPWTAGFTYLQFYSTRLKIRKIYVDTYLFMSWSDVNETNCLRKLRFFGMRMRAPHR